MTDESVFEFLREMNADESLIKSMQDIQKKLRATDDVKRELSYNPATGDIEAKNFDCLTNTEIAKLANLAFIILTIKSNKDPVFKASDLFDTFLANCVFIEDTDAKPDVNEKPKEPYLTDIPIINHVIANSNLMNHLQVKDVIDGKGYDVTMINGNKTQPETTAYAVVSFDTGESGVKIKYDRRITEYQRQVSDAIFTVYLAAIQQNIKPSITADMIFRAMPGGGEHASPQQRGAITKTIEFFRRLEIEVDVTEEYQRRKLIKPGHKKTFKDFYLSAEIEEDRSKNGKTVTTYNIGKTPIILKHCQETRMIVQVNKEYLRIPKRKNGKFTNQPARMTPARQAVTGYLLRRVLAIKDDREKHKKKPKLSNVILFDTIFKECDITHKNRPQAKRDRDFCFDVMEYWKKCRLIKGYNQRIVVGSSQKIDAIIVEI